MESKQIEKKVITWKNVALSDCTHDLECIHFNGRSFHKFYMPCFLFGMINDKMKVVVFGERNQLCNPNKRTVRYVDPANLREKSLIN